MESMNTKEIQEEVLMFRRNAVEIVNNLYDIESKHIIRKVKKIEEISVQPTIEYSPIGVQNILNKTSSYKSRGNELHSQICDLRDVIKRLK